MRGQLIRMTAIGAVAALAAITPTALSEPAAAAAPHAVPGDFDGDGHRDLAVGAPGHNRVRVAYSALHSVVFLKANATSSIHMDFGSSLAVGDFNGDGYSDLAVGAPNFESPDEGGGGIHTPEVQGAVFEFYGSATGLQAASLRLIGPYDGTNPYSLGRSLAAADVNRDGAAELAATLSGAVSDNIRVFRGSVTGLLPTGYQALDDFGASSVAFGDVDNDGDPDLVAGSPLSPADGALAVFFCRPTGQLKATPQTITATQVGVQGGFGVAVATGDINGDGYADVVVGADTDTTQQGKAVGSIVAFTGGADGIAAARYQRFTEAAVNSGALDGDRFGAAVAVGPVTRSGFADVVVGAPQDPAGGHPQAGAIYLVRGSASGLVLAGHQRWSQATAGVPGDPSDGALFGSALWLAQRVGTKNVDVHVGAPRASAGAAHGGAMILLPGSDTGISTTGVAELGNTTAGDELGSAIA